MDGNQSQMLAEIQAAIIDGSLTKSEIERRLDTTVENELSCTDRPADMNLINACEDLQWVINTHSPASLEGRMTENIIAAKAKLTEQNRKRRARQLVARSFAVAAALVFVAIGLEAVIRRTWLQGKSTPDEQQYVITGYEIDPGVIEKGSASGNNEQQSITTTSIDEVIDVLGYSPTVPTWIPQGWTFENYYIRKTVSASTFRATYQAEQVEDRLRFSITTYFSADRALNEFEQNREGIITQENGWDIYVSENQGRVFCIWLDEQSCFDLTGTVSQEDMLSIIDSIRR